MNIVNTSTGFTSTDGLQFHQIGLNSSIGNYESGNLNLFTGGYTRVTIDANGNMGINRLQPQRRLDIGGDVRIGGSDYYMLFCNAAEAIWYNDTFFSWGYGGQYNYFSDNVTIGTSAVPGYNLVVNGSAAKTGGGSWSTLSDARLKDIKGDYDKGLNEIVLLNPIKFTYKAGNPRDLNSSDEQIGFVAQDVQKVFPEAVSTNSDGYLDFNIHAINVALINAVKQLKNENDQLKSSNEKNEARLTEIEKLLIEMKKL